MVTGCPYSHAWQWSFMARNLIQDFCSSANTVAIGMEEQLPYNWINIRLLLQHSALCWEVIQNLLQAPSTCPWICMAPVINMHSVSNVCGVAYTTDEELYAADCLGDWHGVYQVGWSFFFSCESLWGSELWCLGRFEGLTETSSGSFALTRAQVAVTVQNSVWRWTTLSFMIIKTLLIYTDNL